MTTVPRSATFVTARPAAGAGDTVAVRETRLAAPGAVS